VGWAQRIEIKLRWSRYVEGRRKIRKERWWRRWWRRRRWRGHSGWPICVVEAMVAMRRGCWPIILVVISVVIIVVVVVVAPVYRPPIVVAVVIKVVCRM
jgi:hypothetical protein